MKRKKSAVKEKYKISLFQTHSLLQGTFRRHTDTYGKTSTDDGSL